MTAVQPKTFRKQQIETFLERSRSAIRIDIGEDCHVDAYIDMVLDEVEERIGNLSNVRVLIHNYIENELKKEPDSHYFLSLRSNFKPIFEEVIEIEKKMYGVPFYEIQELDATTQAMVGMETPSAFDTIHNVKISDSIINIMNNANNPEFINGFSDQHLEDEENRPFDELPEDVKEKRVLEYRQSVIDKTLETSELEWIEAFVDEDPSFSLLEDVLYKVSKPRPIDLVTASNLFKYIREDHEVCERNKNVLRYENYVDIPTQKIDAKNVASPYNSSLTFLFTVLGITNKFQNELIEYFKTIENEPEVKELQEKHYEDSIEQNKIAYEYITNGVPMNLEAITQYVVTKLICRYPLIEIDVDFFMMFVKFFNSEKVEEFKNALGDMSAYYGERNFFKSEQIATEMCKLTEEHYYVLEPKALEEKLEREKEAEEENKRQLMESYKTYSGDDDLNDNLID